jgi:hypothetical protein
LNNEIKLSRDEMETNISFTAQERLDGVVTVYTDDPVWLRKLDSITAFRDISEEIGTTPPGKVFQSKDGSVSVSLRVKREMTGEQRQKASQRMSELRRRKTDDDKD